MSSEARSLGEPLGAQCLPSLEEKGLRSLPGTLIPNKTGRYSFRQGCSLVIGGWGEQAGLGHS